MLLKIAQSGNTAFYSTAFLYFRLETEIVSKKILQNKKVWTNGATRFDKLATFPTYSDLVFNFGWRICLILKIDKIILNQLSTLYKLDLHLDL